MTVRILKYQFVDCARIDIPRDAVIRHVANQNGQLTVWAEVHDDTRPKPLVRLVAIVTGDSVPDGFAYIGTAMFNNGSFILHVYRRSI